MINFYSFDKIEKDTCGLWYGFLGEEFCEVYPVSSEETEEELQNAGFAKCDAPDTEVFCVEESAWECLKK